MYNFVVFTGSANSTGRNDGYRLARRNMLFSQGDRQTKLANSTRKLWFSSVRFEFRLQLGLVGGNGCSRLRLNSENFPRPRWTNKKFVNVPNVVIDTLIMGAKFPSLNVRCVYVVPRFIDLRPPVTKPCNVHKFCTIAKFVLWTWTIVRGRIISTSLPARTVSIGYCS